MATAETGKKICVMCGKDVAGQPRVKDAKGRYLCAGECQQKAAAAAAAKASAPKPASAGPVPPAIAVAKADGGNLLTNLIDQSPMLKAATCESCGNPMPGGAVICTRCGFNTQTGKALKTAVVVEKVKNEPKAPKVKGKYGNKYAASEFGPSFGILFLIIFGVIAATAAVGFVNPIFISVAFIMGWGIGTVGYFWGAIKAFMNDEPMWGVFAFLPIVSIAFVYYLLFPNEDKWSKAMFAGATLGMIVAGVMFVTLVGIEA